MHPETLVLVASSLPFFPLIWILSSLLDTSLYALRRSRGLFLVLEARWYNAQMD